MAAPTLGCSEAPMDLIWADEPGEPALGSGGVPQAPGAGGGAPGATGGEGGQASSGEVLEPCEDGGEGRFVLGLAGLCLGQGATTTVSGEVTFLAELAPCDGSVEQLWVPAAMGGAYEIRHLATGDNLDIRMAASLDGTPPVLYAAHGWHNQQFFVRESALGGPASGVEGAGRWLAPRHADTKCLTAMGQGAVEIWPCDELREDQRWSIEPLVCPAP